MVFSTTPIDSISWSRKDRWVSVKRSSEAISITAFTCCSNRIGSTTILVGGAAPRPELTTM
ncbi:hypothetical protein D3C86_2097280 [compost metagenome]